MAGVTLGPVSLSGTKITMENPRLAGYRKDNQPYEVTASVAMQDVRKPSVFELKDMKARVAADDSGKMIRLVANFGVFDSTKEQLELREAVRVTTDDGQEARLHSAAVDFKAGTVVSREAVAISLPNGQVEADGIDINDGGKVISFVGNVRAVFEPPPPKPQEAAAVPDAPAAKAEPPKPSPARTSRAEPLSLRP
jgi:lipopolysaccharide export system protein LptC